MKRRNGLPCSDGGVSGESLLEIAPTLHCNVGHWLEDEREHNDAAKAACHAAITDPRCAKAHCYLGRLLQHGRRGGRRR